MILVNRYNIKNINIYSEGGVAVRILNSYEHKL